MSDGSTPDQHLVMLGQIHGLVQSLKDGQEAHALQIREMGARLDKRIDKIDSRFDHLDERVRAVETKAAVSGAVSGGVMGVGMALLIEAGRAFLRSVGKAP